MEPRDDDHYIICELCGDDLDIEVDDRYPAPYCQRSGCPYREPPADMPESERPTIRVRRKPKAQ